MSFEANNNMNTIHLGNYEEFIILYLDNELSDEQVEMVDSFLAAHPDLKAEFEMLQNTKLPLEDFDFDKTALMAENMKMSSVGEELLLYIDGELAAGEIKKLELELASNKDYQLQHQLLLQTKLDPLEKISYPNKKELHRRTERVISIKVWMRAAAAVIIIALSGLLYFKNSTPVINPGSTAGDGKSVQKLEPTENNTINEATPSFENPKEIEVAVTKPAKKDFNRVKTINKQEVKIKTPVEQNNEVAQSNLPQEIKVDDVERPVVKNVQPNRNNIEETTASVNNSNVTSSLLERNINETPVNEDEPIASNDRKGSVKGFLRKATRMIEKRTGIDPTNDGELFIGAVAINLK
jgi:hypothetical protein